MVMIEVKCNTQFIEQIPVFHNTKVLSLGTSDGIPVSRIDDNITRLKV